MHFRRKRCNKRRLVSSDQIRSDSYVIPQKHVDVHMDAGMRKIRVSRAKGTKVVKLSNDEVF